METPRFVKRYAELAPLIATTAAEYATEVRARRFAGPERCIGIKYCNGPRRCSRCSSREVFADSAGRACDANCRCPVPTPSGHSARPTPPRAFQECILMRQSGGD
jgi:hypothetical protein